MQQQLQHKSLFAVKISGSRGSKYNLLCLLWVIWSPVFCISTAVPPKFLCYHYQGSAPFSLGHGDPVPSLKMVQQRNSRGCSLRLAWLESLGLLVSRSHPQWAKGHLDSSPQTHAGLVACQSCALPLASFGEQAHRTAGDLATREAMKSLRALTSL